MKILYSLVIIVCSGLLVTGDIAAQPYTYNHAKVSLSDDGNRLEDISGVLLLPDDIPLWSRQSREYQPVDLSKDLSKDGFFRGPTPFINLPETFKRHTHQHQPSVTSNEKGELLVAYYSTPSAKQEKSLELTVLASRYNYKNKQWEQASEFFKVDNSNDHGTALFYDDKNKTLYHYNGIGKPGVEGWAKLALIQRASTDFGRTWTEPDIIDPVFAYRHQVISGAFRRENGDRVLPCDNTDGGLGGTALYLHTGDQWVDYGKGEKEPLYYTGKQPEDLGSVMGNICGIHAGVVEVYPEANEPPRLLALGRADPTWVKALWKADRSHYKEGHMPVSRSDQAGINWSYALTGLPAIGSGQRLGLIRLTDKLTSGRSPLLLVSFTGLRNRDRNENNPAENTNLGPAMAFIDNDGHQIEYRGLYAALSYDEGQTWPVRKPLTPADGKTYDGGAWTGRFIATKTQGEPAGYVTLTQTPDGTIHLLTSRLYYSFNLHWLEHHSLSWQPSGE